MQDYGMSGRLKIKAAELSQHQPISGAGMELAVAPGSTVAFYPATQCFLPSGPQPWLLAWTNTCALASPRVWPRHLQQPAQLPEGSDCCVCRNQNDQVY